MNKPTLGILTAILALVLGASEALAHGGQYRGPGGAVPPGLRLPHDPTPPNPPPPTGGPVTEPSTGDPHRPSGPVTPGETGGPADPLTGSEGGRTRPSGGATITPDSWVFWYEYNKDALQQVKRGIYQFNGSNHPFGTMTGYGAGARSAQRQGTRALVRTDVIPALLWAMDPKNSGHQDTESAAYLALAKVTDDPNHIPLLQKGLTSENVITREASALALGLLRRERAADQFQAATLDRVRDFLFDTFANDTLGPRTRGFAMLSIGLLGDQPSGSGTTGGAQATTARIFELLQRPYAHEDLPVALLMAAGLQPSTTLTPAHYETLRSCVTKSRLGPNDVSGFVASYAALALGRIGDKDTDVHVLRRVLGSRRTDVHVLRSAIIALGKLGHRCSSEERMAIATDLRDGIGNKRIKDQTARSFALISLAYLVDADIAAGATDVLGRGKIGDFLAKRTDTGLHDERSYAVLALGLVCRAIGDETTVPVYGDFQSEARQRLREGLGARGGPRARAAYAVALGLARDQPSIPDLTALVADAKTDDELRGYAAIALGHIGNGGERVCQPIRRALKERSSEKLRRSTATALGMLNDRKAVPILIEEIAKARSQSTKGQVVIALAQVGDERAVEPLVKLLRDADQRYLTRALACAGLGIVGDIAWVPSLSLLGRDINYRASGDMMNEVLSIL